MMTVIVGTPILKSEIKFVKRVSKVTDQKLISVNTSIKPNTKNKPVVVISPLLKNCLVQFAHAHGHELMYCTAATASIGIKVINDTQLDQDAIKPNKGP